MAKQVLASVKDGYIFNGNKYQYFITSQAIKNPLGKGAFGIVYKATKDNAAYAIKQISKSCGIPVQKIRLELDYMEWAGKAQNSGNVIYAIDSAEDDQFIYIVMPYFDNDNLTKFINKGLISSEIEAIEYFRQMCYGIKILHGLNLIHRDIKTDNIIINSYSDSLYPYKCYFAISDYGLSTNEKDLQTKCVGTGYTMAPEVKTGVYDQKADIFSMGCILYKMLSRVEPFGGVTQNEIDQKKKQKLIAIKCNFPNQQYFSKLTMKILEGCLQTDKNKRLSFAELNSLLDIDNLYKKYVQIKLDEQDSSSIINLVEFNRAHLTVPPVPIARQTANYMLVATVNSLSYMKPRIGYKFSNINQKIDVIPKKLIRTNYNICRLKIIVPDFSYIPSEKAIKINPNIGAQNNFANINERNQQTKYRNDFPQKLPSSPKNQNPNIQTNVKPLPKIPLADSPVKKNAAPKKSDNNPVKSPQKKQEQQIDKQPPNKNSSNKKGKGGGCVII